MQPILSLDVDVLGEAYFGEGEGDIHLSNVMCNGSEAGVGQCDRSPYGVHTCNHSEDAGIRCGGKLCTLFSLLLEIKINMTPPFSCLQ